MRARSRYGRQIAYASDIRSFMEASKHKAVLWGHPQVLGYIDVGDMVDPVITRDEFKLTPARTALYEALVALEKDLRRALDEARNKTKKKKQKKKKQEKPEIYFMNGS